ncbi:hypothetical protein K9B35_17045 [Sphingomonas sp. R647]|uniref:hypothetical protein n=1 Tax=Sphingomonas sp. R647 TaxID=2875233 RepID=UPI001CD57AD6|nr:hypothetical protein [Sphingomonas sp. R647]MCA1199676.1 hypothetical protein [Sphingomonas sp. R647]
MSARVASARLTVAMLAMLTTGCVAIPEPFALGTDEGPMIPPDKLRDRRIEIANTSCTHFDVCKTYQISINHDGTGDMVFYRDGRREVRSFRMSPYAFRKTQLLVEHLRPTSNVSAPVEFDGTHRRGCDHCRFVETSIVHWHRDDGDILWSGVQVTLQDDQWAEGVLRAQNFLLEGMLPSLLGHPQSQPK